MRHHVVKPKGWVRKDRDYIMFEKGPFLHNLALILDLLRKCLYLPKDLEELVLLLSETLSSHKLEELGKCKEEARQLAWKYINAPNSDKSALVLMLLDAIDGFYLAEAKAPDEFTVKKRTA